ncbi:hypothetical protein D5R81_07415 [Parashewanella spongiae]|uniref:Uncharacterized protein n=1 Tax=Parashewanella spongiae TaxID=342950 RepID=A0A3A6U1G2_9GAMM|nr:hypothetical protein [Parashewanella spongiae]MCL1078888.1 hypothetical protein [Parashewanella spongiae]RJY17858.1 hypothetical protein D5R81_07415 [Parashewanella spongiae]
MRRTIQTIYCLTLLLYSTISYATLTIDLPTDIAKGPHNIVYIANTDHNAILQCVITNNGLSACQNFQVPNLIEPYNIVAIAPSSSDVAHPDQRRLYILKRNSNQLYSLLTNNDGRITNQSRLADFATSREIMSISSLSGNILHMERSNFTNDGITHFSIADSTRYGALAHCTLSFTSASVTNCSAVMSVSENNMSYTANLPQFHFNNNGMEIYGLGLTASTLSSTAVRRLIRADVGMEGDLSGFVDRNSAPSSNTITINNNAFSLLKNSERYLVSYDTVQEFSKTEVSTLGNLFPTEGFSSNNFIAPEVSNAVLKQIAHPSSLTGNTLSATEFALFTDDNQINKCTYLPQRQASEGIDARDAQFQCQNAIQHISIEDETGRALSSGTTINLTPENSDSSTVKHGHFIFRNLNYSTLSASELTNTFDTIPSEMRNIFSGTCLGINNIGDSPNIKQDFTEKVDTSSSSVTRNDICTLNYDLDNASSAITRGDNEPLILGFTVSNNGQSTDYNIKFTFNIEADSSPKITFRTTRRSPVRTNSLDLRAGDRGSIFVVNHASRNINASNLIFSLGSNSQGSEDFNRVFDPNSPCLVSGLILQAEASCELRYQVAVDHGALSLPLNLSSTHNNDPSNNISPLMVNIATAAQIVARNANGMMEDLAQIRFDLSTPKTIRLVNIGSAAVNNFSIHFENTPQDVQDLFTSMGRHSTCLTTSNLAPSSSSGTEGGSCTLMFTPNDSLSSSTANNYSISANNPDNIQALTINNVRITAHLTTSRLAILNSQNGPLSRIYQYANDQMQTVTITNNTGVTINDLTISPSRENAPQGTIISNPPSATNSNCYQLIQSETHALENGQSCTISFRIPAHTDRDYHSDTSFRISYGNGLHSRAFQAHLRGQSQLFLSATEDFYREDRPISISVVDSSVRFDLSNHTLMLFITNNSHQNLTLRSNDFIPTELKPFISQNACSSGTVLALGRRCRVSLLFDESVPHLGDYPLTLDAEESGLYTIPLRILSPSMDKIQVDNRGGYIMSVLYTKYYDNSDGNDEHCSGSNACFSQESTGNFSNPSSRTFNNVRHRELTMKIMTGKTKKLLSCRGGKARCTRATVNPSCYYYNSDEATDEANAQNLCLHLNPTAVHSQKGLR